jgi:hypothetical protein
MIAETLLVVGYIIVVFTPPFAAVCIACVTLLPLLHVLYC